MAKIKKKHNILTGTGLCVLLAAMTVCLALFAMRSGSISLSFGELVRGLPSSAT